MAACRPALERFFEKVSPEPNCGCWLWMGAVGKRGYGTFGGEDGMTHRAHRWSYERVNGSIPQGMIVLHKCDVPLCVNPDHLVVGTQAENLADMRRKKRDRPREHAKIGEDQVRQIRASKEPLSALSKRFGLSIGTLSVIRNRKGWKHVK